MALKDSHTLVVLSLLAAIFLPTSTVAIIFTMPIFQFPNDWRNWQYHKVSMDDSSQAGTGNSSSNVETGGTHPPVFSGYFWIYLGISIALTFVVLQLVFYRDTRSRPVYSSDEDEEYQAGESETESGHEFVNENCKGSSVDDTAQSQNMTDHKSGVAKVEAYDLV